MRKKYLTLAIVVSMSAFLATGCAATDKAQDAANITNMTETAAEPETSAKPETSGNTIGADVMSEIDAGAAEAETSTVKADYYGADSPVTVDENGVKHAGGFVLDEETSSSLPADVEYVEDSDGLDDNADVSGFEEGESQSVPLEDVLEE